MSRFGYNYVAGDFQITGLRARPELRPMCTSPHTCCILTLSGPPILTRRADDPLPPHQPLQPHTNPLLKQFSGGLIAFYYRPNPNISGFIKTGRYAYHELF